MAAEQALLDTCAGLAAERPLAAEERLASGSHAFLDMFMAVTVGMAVCVVLLRVLFTAFPMGPLASLPRGDTAPRSVAAGSSTGKLTLSGASRGDNTVRDRLEREIRARLPKRSTYYSMPFFADTLANKQEFLEGLVELGDAPLDGWLLVKKGLQRGKHWKKRFVVLDAHARIKYFPNADAARRNTNVKGSLAVHAVKPADPFEFGANTLEIRGTLGGTYFFRAEDDMAARCWLCVLTMRAIQGHVPGRIDSELSAAVLPAPPSSLSAASNGAGAQLSASSSSVGMTTSNSAERGAGEFASSSNGFTLSTAASAPNLISPIPEASAGIPVRLKSHALEVVVEDMSYDKDASLRQFYVVAKFKSELHDYSGVPVGQTSPKPRGEKGEKGATVKWHEKLAWHFQDHLCSECPECRALGAASGAFCGLPDIVVLRVYEIHLRYLTTKIGEVSLSLRELLGFRGMRSAEFSCSFPVTSTRDAILGQLLLSLKYSADSAGGSESVMPFLVTSSEERQLVGEYTLHPSLKNAREFFDNFYANGTSGRLKEYYNERGDSEMEFSEWEPSKEFGGQIRTISCRSPTNASIGPSHTMTTTTEHLPATNSDEKFVVQSKVVMHDIPYGDCFNVETVRIIQRVASSDSGGSSKLVAKVYLGVPFSKGCMFKSKIISATREAVGSSSRLFFDVANRAMENPGAALAAATPTKPFLDSSEEERQFIGVYDLHASVKEPLQFFDLYYADNTMTRWHNILQETGDTEHAIGKWEDSAEFGGQVREMKYRAKSTSPLGPAFTMATQLAHVSFSSQDRASVNLDRLVIEHKLTLHDIPYGDCFHVETVYEIEPQNDTAGSPLVAKVYIGIPFSKNTMFKSKIMSATKEGVVKSSKVVFDGLKKALDEEGADEESTSTALQPISTSGRGSTSARARKPPSLGVAPRSRPKLTRYNSTLDGSVALEEIFENQRVSLFNKWAPNHLLPTDRPRFSNRDGDKALSFEQVTLPPHWSWTTPWRIDKSYTDCDDEGWSYATDFPRFKFHLARGKSSSKRLGASVRRRRWIRMMVYVPPETSVTEDSPSPPPQLTNSSSRRNRSRGSAGSSSSSSAMGS